MADKKYVGMFVTPDIRKAIKLKATQRGLSIIDQLAEDYL